MSNPTFDIQIAGNSTKTKVLCNGQDISGCIHSVKIVQKAGVIPYVELRIIGLQRHVSFRHLGDTPTDAPDAQNAPQTPKNDVDPM